MTAALNLDQVSLLELKNAIAPGMFVTFGVPANDPRPWYVVSTENQPDGGILVHLALEPDGETAKTYHRGP